MKSNGNYFYMRKSELKSGFTQVPNALFSLKLTATERLVLAYLHSNSEKFRITKYRIQKVLGSDYRTIDRALKRLLDLRLIEFLSPRIMVINTQEIERLGSLFDKDEGIDNGFKKENGANVTQWKNSVASSVPNQGREKTRNPTNSRTTDSCGSTCKVNTSKAQGESQTYASKTTSKISGESHSNNTKQQETEKERKEEVSSLQIEGVIKEVNRYMKIPSKFFFGTHQSYCAGVYERFMVEYPNIKIGSIEAFETALYYYLLRMLNAKDAAEVNQVLSGQDLIIQTSSLHECIKLIINNDNVYQDYENQVNLVRNITTSTQDSGSNENN